MELALVGEVGRGRGAALERAHAALYGGLKVATVKTLPRVRPLLEDFKFRLKSIGPALVGEVGRGRGATLERAHAALYGALTVIKTAPRFRPLLKDLKFRLDSIGLGDIQETGYPNDVEIESLRQKMEEGLELLVKISRLGMWSCYVWRGCCNFRKPSYRDQLLELNSSLDTLVDRLERQKVRDVKTASIVFGNEDERDDLGRTGRRLMSDIVLKVNKFSKSLEIICRASNFDFLSDIVLGNL